MQMDLALQKKKKEEEETWKRYKVHLTPLCSGVFGAPLIISDKRDLI